jgi:hypothetical protein
MSNSSNYGGTFCASGERQICTIGTGYLANTISGAGSRRAGATLTDKRVYFSGSVYSLNNKGRFVSIKQRKIVNNRDITGTGYVFYRPLHYIWWSILSLVLGFFGTAYLANQSSSEEASFIALVFGFILFIVFLITYFTKRMTLLCVEYAGGNIAFDVRWIQKHEQDDFIRNIHLAKDNLYSKSAVEQGFVSNVNDADLIPDL